MDQGAEQARFGLAELAHQVAAAAGAVDSLSCIGEDTFDLFVQLVAVGDDGHAGVGVVLQDPLGQQHHDDAFAAALCVPDDAALVLSDMLLCCLDAEILVHSRQLLHTAIEEHEVVHQLDQPVFAAHLEQVFVQLEAAVILLVFLPLEEILLRRADSAVLQALGIIACKDELHGAEEPFVELRLLVGQVLADAVTDGHAAVLQLQHADGDAVDIEHDIRPTLVVRRAG